MFNNSTKGHDEFSDIEVFEIISTIFVCIVGGIGNILVVLVVCRQSKMRTITNYLIVNLAVSDLFVLFFNIPLDLIVRLSGNKWLYGPALCKVIPPFQTMATTVSVWSLVAISVGRYIAIIYPFRPQLRTHHAKWIILTVWSIGLVVVIPYGAALEVEEGSCRENFEAAGMTTEVFTLAVFVVQYVVPLVIIMVCYVRVGMELSKSNLAHENMHLFREQQKETQKVIKILRLVVTAFAVLVLPIHVYYIWLDFFDGGSSSLSEVFHVIAVVMLYSNSACNPILYNICNEQFRDGFREYFAPCFNVLCPGVNCKKRRRRTSQRESEAFSFNTTNSRLSAASQISYARHSLIPNENCPTVQSNEDHEEHSASTNV